MPRQKENLKLPCALEIFCGLPNRGLWKLSILNVKEGVEHTLVLIKVMIKTII